MTTSRKRKALSPAVQQRRGLSRRFFLKGAGSLAVALPMLERTHGDAFAASGSAKRLIVMFSHGGNLTCRSRDGKKRDGKDKHHHWDFWAPPTESQTLGAVGEEMKPLATLTQHLLLLRGVDNRAGMQAKYGGGHRSSNASALTCADWDGNTKALGPSIDQLIAQRLQKSAPSPFASVDLRVNGHQYGSPHYRAATQQVSSEGDPHAAFSRLFSSVTPGQTGPDPALLRLRALKQSVLDGVKDGISSFRKQLGAADAQTLDAHLTHVRQLEKQLASINTTKPATCTLPNISSAPKGKYGGGTADKIGDAMVDLMVHAMRCGLTRVGTLQISDIITSFLPTPTNVDLGHSLGHRAREIGPTISSPSSAALAWRQEALANRQWRMSLLARLIRGLDAVPEGGKTMLYNSVIVFTSEFSTASVHTVRDVPMLLAGNGGGAFRTGRHINYNTKAKADPNTLEYDSTVSTHNVFTSVLQAFGFNDTHFGNNAAVTKGPLNLA